MALFLMRHCKTKNNACGFFSGQMNIDASELEIDIGGLVREEKKLIVFSSTLNRCKQTYNQLAKYIEPHAICYFESLIERDYGRFEGKMKAEIREKYAGFFDQGIFNYKMTPPEGESFDEFYGRISQFYWNENIAEMAEDNDIIILAHQNVLKAISCIHLNLNPEVMWNKLNFINGGIYKIEEVFESATRTIEIN